MVTLLISGLVYTVSASTNTTPSTGTSSTQPVDNDDVQEEGQSESQADDALEVSTPEQPETIETPETDGVDGQNPAYAASVSAPKDATDEQLGALAKITPDDAVAAAMQDPKLAGGTVNHVELDDENGNVVYSVEVTVGSIVYDAKIDAGTGILLYIDQ